ncbi:PilZ domain-containing protein [Leptospira sp. GIMC2001]|uniref:PilZ domain-containing protein n=1 Tax=Leptospira sp. GIMC2001 TaxID=1513297 RepID=UPI0023495306|nr:PilZ domain-containing protein [Leptospira sp. GIMC2001]WCL49898.1 PilZ domain-containing protein [Leptospira sp. GIMC2001]
MQASLYRPVLPPVSIQFEIIPLPPKHKEISTRGISFQNDSEIELGTTLNVSIKTISITGSIDFSAKVLKCVPVPNKGYFEIYANFFDLEHDKEDEILDFLENI